MFILSYLLSMYMFKIEYLPSDTPWKCLDYNNETKQTL